MLEDQLGQHALVSGVVQGVFFRQGAQQQALALGLHGWVRNLTDGRVEVVWQGPPQGVAAMRAWLQHGPRAARVEQLDCADASFQPMQGFEVLPTADGPCDPKHAHLT